MGREEICSRAEETNTQGGPLGGTSEQSTHTKYFYEGWISSYGDELAGEYKYSLALCPSLSAKISEEQSKKSMSHATLPQRGDFGGSRLAKWTDFKKVRLRSLMWCMFSSTPKNQKISD